MMEITNILQHLFKKPGLDEVPLASLQEMVEKHPYFAAGQFLLSRKLKLENDSAFGNQLQKTNLYFHNPLWLHFNMLKPVVENSSIAERRTGLSGHMISETRHVVTEEIVIEDEEMNEEEPPAPENTAITAYTSPDGEIAVTIAENVPEPEKAETNVQDLDKTENGEVTADGNPQPSPEQAAGPRSLPDAPAEPASRITPEAAAGTPGSRPAKSVFDKDELAFDPYHTIDYFASLGIRLSQDPKPDDKLGQQLKSFTAWLKTMRRLPEITPETVEVNQADLNAHIEKIAAHSLLDKEVITQAMAEVLVMQGNREKAAEIYHKLSLLNPEKSAYFAAKIEELKQY